MFDFRGTRRCPVVQGIKRSNVGRRVVAHAIGGRFLETGVRSVGSVMDQINRQEVLGGPSRWVVSITVRYRVNVPTAVVPQLQL